MVFCALIHPQPIQRLCKYPLLLQDLLRNTPVSDCPSSHDSIRQILETLRILVARINSATGNPVNKDRIQKTILLQGKIDFSDDVCIHPFFRGRNRANASLNSARFKIYTETSGQ